MPERELALEYIDLLQQQLRDSYGVMRCWAEEESSKLEQRPFKYRAAEYSAGGTMEGPVAALLRKRLQEGYDATKREIDRNLYEPLFEYGTATKPLRLVRFARARGWLAERLVDLAEWIGGYDVRGDGW